MSTNKNDYDHLGLAQGRSTQPFGGITCNGN